MRRGDLADLMSFLAVADERNFTRAAAKLGTSQSALSHTIRRLEAQLGLRLLTRTTRSVSLTEAGERLVQTLRPAFDDIGRQLADLTELREKPAGLVRLTTSAHAAETVLWPALKTFLVDYPDIKVEISTDSTLIDIVAERYDAGVRLGESLAKDMIAVPIGPPLRMLLVGSPAYFAQGRDKPRTPHELTDHLCINLRMRTMGGLYVWEFEQDGRELKVRVDGRLVMNDTKMIVRAAVDGFGLAFLMEDSVRPYLDNGQLVTLLEDWCPPFAGYHLYYPSRRQPTPAFAALVDVLRYRA
ncbi:LysR family transcriptional regulator [Caulobacter sp. BP25]|uniref:LysR family transcriptional regulator n=1 Tax=Caulobacter sp. BP25 TaxID=2048900 RepID=UPI000C129BDD|nr:LysR family transcriptional regulator [Caulobacter sp. BP25]PHY17583.1 LysR family transcriptional regulator [Caulobacter sp. BP25]